MTPMNNQPDPFAIRMVFLRVGWMDCYQGITGGDTISSGGAYVAEHGFGHEIFNYQPFQNAVYGYVQPPGRDLQWKASAHRAQGPKFQITTYPVDERSII